MTMTTTTTTLQVNGPYGRALITSQWLRLLPGKCPLTNQVLPYLMELNSEYNRTGHFPVPHHVCVANLLQYDMEMMLAATLCVITISTLSCDENPLFTDPVMIRLLTDFQTAATTDCVASGAYDWRRRYYAVIGYLAEAQRLYRSRNRDLFKDPFVPASPATMSNTKDLAELLDDSNVQMLKDVYYIVTGSATANDSTPADRKSSRAIRLPFLRTHERLTWDRACPQKILFPHSACALGMCGHFAGLIPRINEEETTT